MQDGDVWLIDLLLSPTPLLEERGLNKNSQFNTYAKLNCPKYT